MHTKFISPLVNKQTLSPGVFWLRYMPIPFKTKQELDTFLSHVKKEGFVVPFKRPMTYHRRPMKVTWAEYKGKWYALHEPRVGPPTVYEILESGFGICTVEGCKRKRAQLSPLCDYHKGDFYTPKTRNKLAEVPDSVCAKFCSQWWDDACKAPRTLFPPLTKAEELRSRWVGVRYYPLSIKKMWKFLCLEDKWWEEWRELLEKHKEKEEK